MASTGSQDGNPRPRQRTRRPYGIPLIGSTVQKPCPLPCAGHACSLALLPIDWQHHQVSTEGVTGFPGGHLYGLEPVTGLEPASPPWEGGVLTRGRYRHITFNFQLSTFNFELPEPPTPAKRSKFGKRYLIWKVSVGGPETAWRAPWESNLTQGLCWPLLPPGRPSAPPPDAGQDRSGKSPPAPSLSAPAAG